MAKLDFPVFDADNHLYETEDAFTRHLPSAHKNLFRFAEIGGRKKLVVRDRLTEFIPNPTFEVVARPGAHMASTRRTTRRGSRFASSPVSRCGRFRRSVRPARGSRCWTSRGSMRR
jgi:hypothetical protein